MVTLADAGRWLQRLVGADEPFENLLAHEWPSASGAIVATRSSVHTMATSCSPGVHGLEHVAAVNAHRSEVIPDTWTRRAKVH